MKARTVVVSSVVIVVAAATLVALGASAKKVEVQYVGGEQCAEYPEEVTIYIDRPGNFFKPRKVKWVVDKSLGFEWTFAHKERYGEDFLDGPFEIHAGQKSVKSHKSEVPGVWPYRIDVVDPSGDGGCTVDPELIIYE